MTLPEEREYFNSPSVYRGSTAKPGGSLKNDFWDTPFSYTHFNYFPVISRITTEAQKHPNKGGI